MLFMFGLFFLVIQKIQLGFTLGLTEIWGLGLCNTQTFENSKYDMVKPNSFFHIGQPDF